LSEDSVLPTLRPIVVSRAGGVAVKLINTDGMAFIGPGSEWFWTALSGLVLAVTFIAIYRQLGLQRSAAAIEQMAALDREWRSERLVRAKLAVVLALRDGSDAKDLDAATTVGDFWERIGFLVRDGHIEPRLVNEYFSTMIRTWWARLAAATVASRVEQGAPEVWEHFEWLATRMADMDRKAGRTQAFDEAYLVRTLAETIESCLEGIRAAEELRAVIVHPLSPASLAAEPAPEPSGG
jgi:hypothetical protein